MIYNLTLCLIYNQYVSFGGANVLLQQLTHSLTRLFEIQSEEVRENIRLLLLCIPGVFT